MQFKNIKGKYFPNVCTGQNSSIYIVLMILRGRSIDILRNPYPE